MGDEEIVAALAEEMHDDDCDCEERPCLDGRDSHYSRLATALLPVVRHIAEQRAAEELEAASAAYWRDVTFPIARYPEVREWLRARAAALTATPNHGTDAT